MELDGEEEMKKALVVFILLLAIPVTALATDWDIDPGGAGDYASLNAFDSGEATNLVTATAIYNVYCRTSDGTGDGSVVTFGTGWTTSASYYINVEMAAAQKHAGVLDTSKYWMDCDAPSNDGCMLINGGGVDNMIVDGIQFVFSNVSSTDESAIHLATDGTFYFRNIIARGDSGSSASYHDGFAFWDGTSATTYLYNNLVYNFRGSNDSSGVVIYDSDKTVYIYNNTFYNVEQGMWRQSGTGYANNNICRSADTNCMVGTFNAATDYNSCDDSTCTARNATQTSGSPWDSSSDADGDFWTDAASDDFHLTSTSIAGDVGQDLSGTLTDDYEGDTRDASFDLGADEYVSAAAPRRIFITSEVDDGTENFSGNSTARSDPDDPVREEIGRVLLDGIRVAGSGSYGSAY